LQVIYLQALENANDYTLLRGLEVCTMRTDSTYNVLERTAMVSCYDTYANIESEIHEKLRVCLAKNIV
ncbi:hypothetical protein PMAYCL1PPCAC_21258, partial [Pristionchus mayeri]